MTTAVATGAPATVEKVEQHGGIAGKPHAIRFLKVSQVSQVSQVSISRPAAAETAYPVRIPILATLSVAGV